jgi:hypothetical protein
MRKTGRIWEVVLVSEKFPCYRYICEDGNGELWQFYISESTHEEIEENEGDIIGKYVQWDYRRRALRFLM